MSPAGLGSAVIALLVAGAVLLVLPLGPQRPVIVVDGAGDAGTRRRSRRGVLLAASVMAAVVVALGPVQVVALPVVGAAVAIAGARMVAGRRRDNAAAERRSRVVDLCDALRAELAAGQTAAGALDRAAAEWPFVEPAARAALSGGDVVAELRALGAVPGADALRIVAGAWLVAHRTGHGLADTLGRVAADLRAADRTRRIVGGELASARATARLLAGLPLVALLMGSSAGADPLRFLLGGPAGLACLGGGLLAGYAGLVWIEALARNVERHG